MGEVEQLPLTPEQRRILETASKAGTIDESTGIQFTDGTWFRAKSTGPVKVLVQLGLLTAEFYSDDRGQCWITEAGRSRLSEDGGR